MARKPPSPKERLLCLVRKRGILRARDLADQHIPREYLRRLLDEGLIERPTRGIYVSAHHAPSEHHTLAQAAMRVPKGVICLLSALRFHGLTTQAPFEIWMAIPEKARAPKNDKLPLRFVRFSGSALTSGIQEHRIDGVPARVYNVPKTIADCFKYRNQIGLDVAIEALRDCRRRKKATMDQLWQAAQVCRVANVIRPYLEAIS